MFSEILQWAAFIGVIALIFVSFAVVIGPDPLPRCGNLFGMAEPIHRCSTYCRCFR